MGRPTAFVELRKVYVDYEVKIPFFHRLGRHIPQQHSVLRDVNLTLPHGSWVTLFGGPGAGKTTLLRTLVGAIKPTKGFIVVNGHFPHETPHLAAGYVSGEESEGKHESVYDSLTAFGMTHRVAGISTRISEAAEAIGIASLLYRPVRALSTSQRLRVNLARAAISAAPLVLLDDTADELGAKNVRSLLPLLFTSRSVIIATRFVPTAEQLDLPLWLLHDATVIQSGTCDEIATNVACPRQLDVWVEGLRYDLLRSLRKAPGVLDVRLTSSSSFAGQRLRITVQSARYLPSVYDLISQTALVRVQEIPASLADILKQIHS